MKQPSAKKRVLTRRRLKEWELNPFLFSFWQRLFHFERFEFLFSLAIPLLKITGIYNKGLANARNIRMHQIHLKLERLPSAFDGYRILFLSDLHADSNKPAIRRLIESVQNLSFDLVLLGGDYRFRIKGIMEKALNIVHELLGALQAKDGIFAVLGNHDPWESIESMEAMGIRMLVNEASPIQRDGQTLWILGLDDAHFFESDDFKRASQTVPKDAFRLVLCHSNDALIHIPANQCDLFLSGHTHGGQICLPIVGAPLIHSRMPRFMARNYWQYKGIHGITTTGVGTSGLPIRFNCPGEFVIIELHKAKSNH